MFFHFLHRIRLLPYADKAYEMVQEFFLWEDFLKRDDITMQIVVMIQIDQSFPDLRGHENHLEG